MSGLSRVPAASSPRGARPGRRASLLLLLPLLAAFLLVRPVRTVHVERRQLARLRWGSGAGEVGRYLSLDGLWRGPTAVATDASGRPVILDAANHRLLEAVATAPPEGEGGGAGRKAGGGIRWRAASLPGSGWYTALAPLPQGWLLADGRSGALLALRPGPDPGEPLPLMGAPDGREVRWRRILLLRGQPGALAVLASEGGTRFVRRRLWLLEEGRLRPVGESAIQAPGGGGGGLILSAAPARQGIAALLGGPSPLLRRLVRLGAGGPERLFSLELRSPGETVDLLGELPGLGWLLWRSEPGGPARLELRDTAGARTWSASLPAGPPYILHPAWLAGRTLTLLEPGRDGVRVERWLFSSRWTLAWRW
ncbi:MAG: hypothetical protein QJR08_08910 [Bacillota bacterium]|nr:hypothetical protein [Bacillota bacterium]